MSKPTTSTTFRYSEARPDAVAVHLDYGTARVRVTVRRSFTAAVEVEGTDGIGDACWVRMASPPADIVAAALYFAVQAAPVASKAPLTAREIWGLASE